MRALYQLSYSPTIDFGSLKKLDKNRKRRYRIPMKKYCEQLLPIISPVEKILQALIAAGATPYLVGGCVRDLVLNQPLKDLDIELHNVSLKRAEEVLGAFGHVMLVGKQFGVLRLAEFTADWSLPRRDSTGRKPEVAIVPDLGIMEACRRRDLTMNAMAIDLQHLLTTGTVNIIDHFGGLDDIALKQLRAVDGAFFVHDPLRFFRVMQFVSRFEMTPDPELDALCAHMALHDPVTGAPVALERIVEEIKKLFLHARYPSLGFRWLAKIGRIQALMPELAALIDTPQRADYHPEGNVFEHSMQAIDAAARFKEQGLVQNDAEALLIGLATLCHDLGKAVTTTPELRAHGHDEAGVPLAASLLKRITNDQSLIKAVQLLVRHHLAPFILVAEQSKPKAYKRLAARLGHAVSMRQLGLVALADRQGRNGAGHEPLSAYHDLYEQFLDQCEEATVTNQPEPPLLQGRDLLDEVGPGPALGQLLKKAYLLQIEEGITDPVELRKRILPKKYS